MKYYLVESCQNTFILFYCLDQQHLEDAFLQQIHKCLKMENRDDALILYRQEIETDSLIVEMGVLGLDGQIGEFCGNGALASGAFLFKHAPKFKKIFLKTKRGLHLLSKKGENKVSVRLPKAKFEWNKKFILKPELFKELYDLVYVETGEPHLLINQALGDEELFILGRELNQRRDLFPLGINVNAWHVLQKGHIFVKTYERGVQRLTRSCGTGSLACASFYQNEQIIEVCTPGGPLKIIFHDHEVELCGAPHVTSALIEKF